MKIFVFGSNTAGIHGGGAARYAVEKHGAIMGQGEGLQGTSYALPTKDKFIQTLDLAYVHQYVKRFMHFARLSPGYTYMVTKVGCGLAGLTPEQIAPMFTGRPSNVRLPIEFLRILHGNDGPFPKEMISYMENDREPN